MWELANTEEARALIGGTVAFCLWMAALATALLCWRGTSMAAHGKRIDEFPSGLPHGSDRYWRVNRAHANAAENVGLVAGVLLATFATGITGVDVRILPLVVVGARVVQTLAHVASGSRPAVTVRVTAYGVQLASLAWLAGRDALALLT